MEETYFSLIPIEIINIIFDNLFNNSEGSFTQLCNIYNLKIVLSNLSEDAFDKIWRTYTVKKYPKFKKYLSPSLFSGKRLWWYNIYNLLEQINRTEFISNNPNNFTLVSFIKKINEWNRINNGNYRYEYVYQDLLMLYLSNEKDEDQIFYFFKAVSMFGDIDLKSSMCLQLLYSANLGKRLKTKILTYLVCKHMWIINLLNDNNLEFNDEDLNTFYNFIKRNNINIMISHPKLFKLLLDKNYDFSYCTAKKLKTII